MFKKIKPLKLFNNDISSSSSSVENDEGEENESNHKEIKVENIEMEKKETEYTNNNKFKKSEGDLSEDLNQSNEDIKGNNHILKKN